MGNRKWMSSHILPFLLMPKDYQKEEDMQDLLWLSDEQMGVSLALSSSSLPSNV